MIAYKGFRPGLICRGYQFVMGLNTTEKANCRENGFHCAEDPLDCLSYYSSLEHSEYYIVNAGGDIDEDEHDSKIACTELTVIKRLTKEELFLHGLAYMVDHPRRVWSSHVAANRAMANCGYAVVRGKDPVATGRLGDILAFAKEAPDSESIVQVAVGQIDGASAVKEFWENVKWGDIDCMFVDCPPGTGDVPLTVFQSLPVVGSGVVTSPQELVSMIVEKAVNMANMMDIPVLGIVENMSYFECPDCGKKHEIFGKSHIDEIAAQHDIKAVAKLPINPEAASKVDGGFAEDLDVSALDNIFEAIRNC